MPYRQLKSDQFRREYTQLYTSLMNTPAIRDISPLERLGSHLITDTDESYMQEVDLQRLSDRIYQATAVGDLQIGDLIGYSLSLLRLSLWKLYGRVLKEHYFLFECNVFVQGNWQGFNNRDAWIFEQLIEGARLPQSDLHTRPFSELTALNSEVAKTLALYKGDRVLRREKMWVLCRTRLSNEFLANFRAFIDGASSRTDRSPMQQILQAKEMYTNELARIGTLEFVLRNLLAYTRFYTQNTTSDSGERQFDVWTLKLSAVTGEQQPPIPFEPFIDRLTGKKTFVTIPNVSPFNRNNWPQLISHPDWRFEPVAEGEGGVADNTGITFDAPNTLEEKVRQQKPYRELYSTWGISLDDFKSATDHMIFTATELEVNTYNAYAKGAAS